MFAAIVFFLIIVLVVILSGSQNEHTPKTVSKDYSTGYTPQKIAHTEPKTVDFESKKSIDYNNLPYSSSILIRFCRMKNKEFICVDMNRLNETAIFESRFSPKKHYHTTLHKCTCPDCEAPCKHMLFLADSLGYLDNWKRDIPQETYNNIARTYNNCRYRNDPVGWIQDKNWHPGRTRIGGCW